MSPCPALFPTAACTDAAERLALQLVQTPPGRVKAIWCGPKAAGSTTGATYSQELTCAISCQALAGFQSGITMACISACKTNVYAYGPPKGMPPQAGSASASYNLDSFLQCANSGCGGSSTYNAYLSCAGVDCLDLYKMCSGT